MQYAGFILQYQYSSSNEIKFEGPYATWDKAKEHYDDLQSLVPTVKNIRIGRLVINPFNPAFQ